MLLFSHPYSILVDNTSISKYDFFANAVLLLSLVLSALPARLLRTKRELFLKYFNCLTSPEAEWSPSTYTNRTVVALLMQLCSSVAKTLL